MNFYRLDAEHRKGFPRINSRFFDVARPGAPMPGSGLVYGRSFQPAPVRRGALTMGRGRPVAAAPMRQRTTDGREAPACMRCRGLTLPDSALTCRFLGQSAPCLAYHRTHDPCAAPGPPGPAQPLGSPPRWAAVQVVNDFVLPRLRDAQGVLAKAFKILFASTELRLLSPGNLVYPPTIHSNMHTMRR
jgi:hypothetical protein